MARILALAFFEKYGVLGVPRLAGEVSSSSPSPLPPVQRFCGDGKKKGERKKEFFFRRSRDRTLTRQRRRFELHEIFHERSHESARSQIFGSAIFTRLVIIRQILYIPRLCRFVFTIMDVVIRNLRARPARRADYGVSATMKPANYRRGLVERPTAKIVISFRIGQRDRSWGYPRISCPNREDPLRTHRDVNTD